MATLQQAVGPPGRLERLRRDSRPQAVLILALGVVALGLVLVGGFAVLAARGITPHPALVRGIESGAFATVQWAGIVVGICAIVAGIAGSLGAPTKVAREEAIAGAVLGVQAAALAGVILWFRNGDVELFARIFLDFRVLPEELGTFARAAKNTLVLAIGSEAMGIALGLVLALLVSSRRAVVRAPARTYVNLFRGTPLLWQISFISLVMFSGFELRLSTYVVGMIILAMNAGAYTAEVFRAGIQSIERGQLDAARGLGMSYLQSMRYAIVPQAFRRVIPPLMNEFVILVKDTSLVFVLGLTVAEHELMKAGNSLYLGSFNATYLLGTAAGYLAVTLPLIRIVNVVERRLRSGLVSVTGG